MGLIGLALGLLVALIILAIFWVIAKSVIARVAPDPPIPTVVDLIFLLILVLIVAYCVAGFFSHGRVLW